MFVFFIKDRTDSGFLMEFETSMLLVSMIFFFLEKLDLDLGAPVCGRKTSTFI